MATDFYTRSGGGKFQITLETDRPEHFEFMQEAARICVDGKSADFVPVVRCKDCRHRMHHPDSYKTLLCTNKHWPAEFLPVVNDDHFCAYGDREDGVNDGN